MAALKLETLRNAIRTSIFGRRLGFDTTPDQGGTGTSNIMRGGLLVGHPGQRLPIQTITTTAGSSICQMGGYVELGATTGSTNTLIAPAIPGTEITFTQTATSTLGMQVVSSGVFFNSSTGSSANSFTLWGQGASIRVVALSTVLYGVVSGLGQTTAMVSFSSV